MAGKWDVVRWGGKEPLDDNKTQSPRNICISRGNYSRYIYLVLFLWLNRPLCLKNRIMWYIHKRKELARPMFLSMTPGPAQNGPVQRSCVNNPYCKRSTSSILQLKCAEPALPHVCSPIPSKPCPQTLGRQGSSGFWALASPSPGWHHL